MNQADVMDYINEVERRFPVDRWIVAGVHVWPLIRIDLANKLFQHCQLQVSPPARSPIETTLRRFARLTTSMYRYLRARWADAAHDADLRIPAEAVLMGSGVSYTKLGGAWFDKYCDPMIARLKDRGVSTLLLTPMDLYPTPRYSPSVWIQPALKQAWLASRFVGWWQPDPPHDLPEFEAFLEDWRLRFPDVPRMTGKEVLAHVRTIEHYTQYFKDVLIAARARIGLVVTYYGPWGMAFVRACRELGIPSVDIQHGIQGDLHMAYGRWKRLPPTGYDLLPTIFWTWGEEEASAVRRWSQPLQPHHRAVIGGNLLLMDWRKISRATGDEYEPAIADVVQRTPGARHILLSLHSFESEAELDAIRRRVGQSSSNWVWWLRHHPCRPEQRSVLSALLADLPADRYNVALASDAPLYTLLEHIDVHVTDYSTVTLEAEQLGVPTVITHPLGAELYPLQLENGWAYFAPTETDLPGAIHHQLELRDELRSKRAVVPPPPGFEELLESLRPLDGVANG